MPRPSAVKVATIEANMEIIARAEDRKRAMAMLQRGAVALAQRASILVEEEAAFIDRCRAENAALEAGRRSQVAA